MSFWKSVPQIYLKDYNTQGKVTGSNSLSCSPVVCLQSCMLSIVKHLKSSCLHFIHATTSLTANRSRFIKQIMINKVFLMSFSMWTKLARATPWYNSEIYPRGFPSGSLKETKLVCSDTSPSSRQRLLPACLYFHCPATN